jgi:phage terminase large subunit-like protein
VIALCDHGVVTTTLPAPYALAQLPLAERSPKEKLASLPPDVRRAWLIAQDPVVIESIGRGDWWFERRAKQTEPAGQWLVWVVGSGRGWGKNRVGAETLIEWVERYPRDRAGNRTEWMVVAETLKDVVDLNIEGPSGILNVLRRLGYRKIYRPPRDDAKPGRVFFYTKAPKPTITLYPSQQVIHFDSADNSDVGRGYNLSGLWCDELAKWGAMAHDAWYEGLLPALRADIGGWSPRCIVTTTPKPIGLLKEWYTRARAGDPMYHLTIGSTYENAANLNPITLRELIRELEGTRKGLQELHGHLLDEVEGALWTRQLLEDTRHLVHKLGPLPPLVEIALGCDPAGTGTGDEQGLIVIGASATYEQFVLEDLSRKIAGLPAARLAWKAVLDARRHCVDPRRMPKLIVEEDYGKKWLKDTLQVVFESMQAEGLFDRYDRPPIEFVKAAEQGGKLLRAEPIAMRYEVRRIHHAGIFPGLEDQQCTWDPKDPKAKSPDRVDGLVHGATYLKGRENRTSSVSDRLDHASLPTTRLTPLG